MGQQVLRVTLNKKATVRLDFHFRGFTSVELSRAEWKSTLPLEKQFGLFLVLEDGDQFMVTEIGPDRKEGIKFLDIKSYNNFSLKLAVINENETTEVEHKEESCKDSDNFLNDFHVNVLCRGTNSALSQDCINGKHLTSIISLKMNLDSTDHSFNLDTFFKTKQIVYLSEAYLVPFNNGSKAQPRQVFLNLLKDCTEFSLTKFYYHQNNQRTRFNIFLPSGFFKMSQRPSFRDDLSVDHEMEKKNESSANNAGNSVTSIIEIKLLLHSFASVPEFAGCFPNHFLLRANVPLHINLNDQTYQKVDSLTVHRIFVSSSKQEVCDRSVVSVKFGAKFPPMVLDDVKGSFLTHQIDEILTGPSFSLSMSLYGQDDETSSSADQVIGLVSYTANFKPSSLGSPVSRPNVYTDTDIDFILKDFNRIRDKFRNDVVFMREKDLFECDTLLIGDSILRSVDPSLLLQTVYVQSLGGCTIEQLNYILGVLKMGNLKRLIIHIGVNNTHGFNNICNVSDEAAKYHQLLATCRRKAPNAKIFLSGIVARFDKTYCTQWATNLNRELMKITEQDPELTFINNFSVTYDQYGNKIGANLAHDNLHISYQGTTALLKSINYVTKISDQPSLQLDKQSYTSGVEIEYQTQGDTTPLVDQFPFKQTYFYQNGAASTAEKSTCEALNKADPNIQKTSKKKKRAVNNLTSDASRTINQSNRSSFSTFSALSSSVEDFLSGIEPLEDDKTPASKVFDTSNIPKSMPMVDNGDQVLELTSSTESEFKDIGPLTSTMAENSMNFAEPAGKLNERSFIVPPTPTDVNSSNQSEVGVNETNESLSEILDTSFSAACSLESSTMFVPKAVKKRIGSVDASKGKWNYRQAHNDSNGQNQISNDKDSKRKNYVAAAEKIDDVFGNETKPVLPKSVLKKKHPGMSKSTACPVNNDTLVSKVAEKSTNVNGENNLVEQPQENKVHLKNSTGKGRKKRKSIMSDVITAQTEDSEASEYPEPKSKKAKREAAKDSSIQETMLDDTVQTEDSTLNGLIMKGKKKISKMKGATVKKSKKNKIAK